MALSSLHAFKEGGGCEFKGVLVNSRGCSWIKGVLVDSRGACGFNGAV